MPFGELIEKIPILPINKGFKQAKKRLDTIVFNMIKEHRDNQDKDMQKMDFTHARCTGFGCWY